MLNAPQSCSLSHRPARTSPEGCYLHSCHSSQVAVHAGRAPSSSSQRIHQTPSQPWPKLPQTVTDKPQTKAPGGSQEMRHNRAKCQDLRSLFNEQILFPSIFDFQNTFSETIWCQKKKYLIPILFTLDTTPPMIICQRFNCAWKLARNNAREA